MIWVGWLTALLAALCFLFAQCVYGYEQRRAMLWLDQHLEREGQPVPVRKGLRWQLFLLAYRRFK